MSEHAKLNRQSESGKSDKSASTPTPGYAVDSNDLHRAISEPSLQTLSPEVVMALQQSHGNQFVQRLIAQTQQSTPADPSAIPSIQQTDTPAIVQRMAYSNVSSYISSAYLMDPIESELEDKIIQMIVNLTEKWQYEGNYFDRQKVVENILNKVSSDMMMGNGPALKTGQDWVDYIGPKLSEAELEEKSEKKEKVNVNLPTIPRDQWVEPWKKAIDAKLKSSGHGGVVFVYFGNQTPIIVKGGKPMEALGAELAREVGLRAPRTRVVAKDSQEEKSIDSIQVEYNAAVPNGKPYLVVEFVPGIELGELKKSSLNAKQAVSLAASLGQWMAFDILIAESDRFNTLTSNINDINSANFFLDPRNQVLHITGIDQSVLKSDTPNGAQVLKMIQSKTPASYFVSQIGQLLSKFIGDVTGVNEDSLAESFIVAAQQQIKDIGKNLDKDKVENKAQVLGMDKSDVQGLLTRLEAYKK